MRLERYKLCITENPKRRNLVGLSLGIKVAILECLIFQSIFLEIGYLKTQGPRWKNEHFCIKFPSMKNGPVTLLLNIPAQILTFSGY